MGEFIVFVLLVVLMALAVVGAVRVSEWLSDTDERRDLARRERQAELEIQQIAHQAQVAMLSEAMKRAQAALLTGQPLHRPDVVEGEVLRTIDVPDDAL